MNQTFNKYIDKIKNITFENPIKKAFNSLKDYVMRDQITKRDLIRAAPNSYREIVNFKQNFRKAVQKDMDNMDKKTPPERTPKMESVNEDKNMYNEKFDIGNFIEIAPVIYYTFVFLIFIGEERYEKFKVKMFAFLDKKLGKYLND